MKRKCEYSPAKIPCTIGDRLEKIVRAAPASGGRTDCAPTSIGMSKALDNVLQGKTNSLPHPSWTPQYRRMHQQWLFDVYNRGTMPKEILNQGYTVFGSSNSTKDFLDLTKKMNYNTTYLVIEQRCQGDGHVRVAIRHQSIRGQQETRIYDFQLDGNYIQRDQAVDIYLTKTDGLSQITLLEQNPNSSISHDDSRQFGKQTTFSSNPKKKECDELTSRIQKNVKAQQKHAKQNQNSVNNDQENRWSEIKNVALTAACTGAIKELIISSIEQFGSYNNAKISFWNCIGNIATRIAKKAAQNGAIAALFKGLEMIPKAEIFKGYNTLGKSFEFANIALTFFSLCSSMISISKSNQSSDKKAAEILRTIMVNTSMVAASTIIGMLIANPILAVGLSVAIGTLISVLDHFYGDKFWEDFIEAASSTLGLTLMYVSGTGSVVLGGLLVAGTTFVEGAASIYIGVSSVALTSTACGAAIVAAPFVLAAGLLGGAFYLAFKKK